MAEQPNQQRTSLKDVINYEPEKYLQDDELSLIRSTFKDNPRLINVLRKILVPTISDMSLPIEQMGNDIFGAGRAWEQIPADEAKILYVARQDALQFILGGLIKLKVLANEATPSPISLQNKRDKDSVK